MVSFYLYKKKYFCYRPVLSPKIVETLKKCHSSIILKSEYDRKNRIVANRKLYVWNKPSVFQNFSWSLQNIITGRKHRAKTRLNHQLFYSKVQKLYRKIQIVFASRSSKILFQSFAKEYKKLVENIFGDPLHSTFKIQNFKVSKLEQSKKYDENFAHPPLKIKIAACFQHAKVSKDSSGNNWKKLFLLFFLKTAFESCSRLFHIVPKSNS